MPSITVVAYGLDQQPAPALTPVWLVWKDVATGNDADQPNIFNRGLGEYSVEDPPAGECGILDFGPTAAPRRVFIGASEGTVLALFDYSGLMVEGATPVWHTYRNNNGDAVTPQPTFAHIGNGMYRVDGLISGAEGLVDFGEGTPRFQFVGPVILVQDLAAPEVSNLVPAAGTRISRTQTIEFDVTDNRDISTILIAVKFAGLRGITELAWDGEDSVGLYTVTWTDLVVADGDGYHFVISRAKGWPSSPTIRVFAVDSFGNEISDAV